MAIHRLDELWHDDTDEKLYRRTGQTMTEVSPSTGGTGEGQINYAKNPLQESSVNFLTYSGFTPVWATTYNLYGGGAIKCTMTSSGTGRYLRIALDDLSDAQITEMLRLSFFYKLTEGGDDAVRLSIWNGTNHTYLTPEYLVSASGDITKYDGWCFSISKTSHYLQFTFKDSTAITLYLADLVLAPRVLPQGAVISEWQSYTPTFTGFGTVTNIDAKWRRIGSNMELLIRALTGTHTTASNRITLPSGYSSTQTKIQVGHGSTLVSSTAGYVNDAPIIVPLNEPTVIAYSSIGNGSISYNLTPINGNALAASNMELSIFASIPISGWTSSINLVTEAQEFAFNTQATINTNDTTSFGYGPGGTPILAHTMEIYYDVKFKRAINQTDTILVEILENGIWQPSNQRFPYNATQDCGIRIVMNTGYNDRVRVYFQHYTEGTSAWSTATSLRWRVRKISNGNMAEAPASGIYESGQNANGYYVKYVDGTMVQWGMDAGGASPRTKTFPVPFADTNYQVFFTPHVPAGTLPRLVVGLTDRAPVGYSPGSVMQYKVTYTDTNTGAGEAVGFYTIGKWNLSRSVAAPGTPVGASTVFAHCKNSAANVSGANQPINFDTVVEDSLSCITTGTNWKFTAPVSGLYSISGTLYNSAGDANIYLYKNGSVFNILGNSKLNMTRMILSTTIRLNQGDYFDIRGDVSVTLNGANIQITRLSA